MGTCCTTTTNTKPINTPSLIVNQQITNPPLIKKPPPTFIRSNTRHSTKEHISLSLALSNVYSITKFGSKIRLDQSPSQLFKFQFHLHKFRCRMLQEKNYYILKITFDTKDYIAPLVSGSNPKFLFDETITRDIKYEDIESHWVEINLYSLPTSVDIYKIKGKEELIKKASLYAGYKVDLITIALGPENHDMILLDRKVFMGHLGRISYTIQCQHVDNMTLVIESAKVTLSYLHHNDVSLKLKYIAEGNQSESGYTIGMGSNMISKEEKSVFEFNQGLYEDENMLVIKTKGSLQELRRADSTVNLYNIRLIDRGDSNKNANTCAISPSRKDSNSHTHSHPSSHTLNFFQKNPNITDIKLINHYSLIGLSTLDFHKILSENEEASLRQSSQFFRQVSGFKRQNSNANNQSSTPVNEFLFQAYLNLNHLYTEQIYFNGVCIGKIDLRIRIDNIPLIRQIICGIMTESGFEINSIHLYDNIINVKTCNSTLPDDLQLLAKQKVSLETELMKLKQPIAQSQYNKSLIAILEEIKVTLGRSIEDNCLYYGYSTNEDLFTGQSLMLNIGLTLLDVEDKLTPNQRTIIFAILKLINDRAEFDLGTLYTKWFVEEEPEQGPITITKSTSYVIRDNRLIDNKQIEHFIEFNYNCLMIALEGITRMKTYDNAEKQFSEYFLSLAYFRLPIFRKQFIESIAVGIKASTFNSNQLKVKKASIEDFLESDPINNLILWDILFYDRLTSALAHLTMDNDIQEKLNKINRLCSITDVSNKKYEWREKLMQRDVAFFNLVKIIDNFLLGKVASLEIKWLNIPGYETILNALIHEIEVRDIRLYPKQLMELIPIFIDNIAIVNEFTKRILLKTNVHDVNAVFNIVTIIDGIFTAFGHKIKVKEPSASTAKFDYNILSVAMKRIIENDHSLCVAKFLWLYYKNAHLMNISHLADICQSVFLSKFYSLFFHWSWQVRNIFFFFIMYIIGFRIRNITPFKDREDVKLIKISNEQLGKEYTGQVQRNFGVILNEKMKLIEALKEIVDKEKFDPSFNNIINPVKYAEALKQIPNEIRKNVVISLYHFDQIKKDYISWEQCNKNRKENDVEYPKIILVTPRDDVVEYSGE